MDQTIEEWKNKTKKFLTFYFKTCTVPMKSGDP